MLKLTTTSSSDEASNSAPACWISGIALTIALAGAVSIPASAQSGSAAPASGELKIASNYYYYNHPYSHRRARRHTHRKNVSRPAQQPKWILAKNPKDPIQIIVSLPERRLTVYRGDEILVRSRISSGRKGFATPSGVFSILQKNRYHRSNIYSGAPMPYMQRLTWSGIALHGFTSVPNVPASAGCIRLPMSFASKLFKFTEKGAHVIVANEKTEPSEIKNGNLLQPSPRGPNIFASLEKKEGAVRSDATTASKKRSNAPLRILITRRTEKGRIMEVQKLLNELTFEPGDLDGYMGRDTAKSIKRFQATYGLKVNGRVSDELLEKLYEVAEKEMPANGQLYVRQDFKPVFDAPVVIKDQDQPLGSHLFTAMYFKPDATETRWTAVTLKKGSLPNKHALHGGNIRQPVKGVDQTPEALLRATAVAALDRIVIPEKTRKRLAGMLTPGSSIAISDDGISWETAPKGGSDFIVLMQ